MPVLIFVSPPTPPMLPLKVEFTPFVSIVPPVALSVTFRDSANVAKVRSVPLSNTSELEAEPRLATAPYSSTPPLTVVLPR